MNIKKGLNDMKMYTLTRYQKLPVTPEEAWAFFSNPKQLEEITPDDMPFEMIGDGPPGMYAGMIIEYNIEPFPKFPVKWITEITHVEEGKYFVDEQRFGPFKFWHHQHHFREIEGGVEIIDTVNYILPFSLIGRITHNLVVKGRLAEIFDFRQKTLKAAFGEIEN
ncbi:SRPBCC family protein [Salinicoccus sp. YB14-2]|uniref:SRPBCC family protein n=1 Tax=Salinicoccus sp. YB14-2 TaxID=1572701 RepID=UPI001E637D16|nr:SRPBCC family protein [Salinicoccus sp. YB14-2]